MLRLIGIETLTKGIPANLLARYFVLSVYLDPPQDAASVGVALIESNLPKCGSAVRPKVIPNEPYGGFNELQFNPLRFRAARHRPGEI
jgi:hypothetical protein